MLVPVIGSSSSPCSPAGKAADEQVVNPAETVEVHGVVVDEDGQPVTGARVWWRLLRRARRPADPPTRPAGLPSRFPRTRCF